MDEAGCYCKRQRQRKDKRMSTEPMKVDPPKDPDPAPRVVNRNNQELQQAKRQQQKNAVNSYGRQQTVLTAGESSLENGKRKTILGA